MSDLFTFRDALTKVVPPWLQGFWGTRYLYALGVQIDAMGDALRAGVKLRFPNVYSDESLALLGRERGIKRGLFESAEAYALRLDRWLDDGRTKGNPWNLMHNVQAYLAPHGVRLRYVNNLGFWRTLNADGTREYTRSSAWNWDGNATPWSRFWLVIYPPAALWERDGVWTNDEFWGDDGTTWGSTASPEQVESVRAIVADCMGPHSQCENIIVAFDDAAFDPADPSSMADGLWGLASKYEAGVQIPSRDDRAIYWDGSS